MLSAVGWLMGTELMEVVRAVRLEQNQGWGRSSEVSGWIREQRTVQETTDPKHLSG